MTGWRLYFLEKGLRWRLWETNDIIGGNEGMHVEPALVYADSGIIISSEI